MGNSEKAYKEIDLYSKKHNGNLSGIDRHHISNKYGIHIETVGFLIALCVCGK